MSLVKPKLSKEFPCVQKACCRLFYCWFFQEIFQVGNKNLSTITNQFLKWRENIKIKIKY